MISLIIDTDMGNDIDDALALILAHTLETKGECKLLGVAINKDNYYAAAFVDIVNTFYGRGEVPIGVIKDGKTPESGHFVERITRSGEYKRTCSEYSQDAVAMYRELLAGSQDGSVVIASIGFMTNLARLLVSGPDEYSELNGRELVAKKVKTLSAMAGNFAPKALKEPTPQDAEFNIVMDIESAKFVCDQWPGEIIFTGLELGFKILYPAKSVYEDFNWADSHPVAQAYCMFKPMPYDRPTWDLISVLYPVRSGENYFGISPCGKVDVRDDGVNTFTHDIKGSHRYLTIKDENIPMVRDVMRSLCAAKRAEVMIEV